MEAHAGTVSIGAGTAVAPRPRRLAGIRTAIRRKRIARAERVYAMRMTGNPTYSVPGSEHSHLIRRPRGF